jgi:cob(I)alamin adenosyltransferase
MQESSGKLYKQGKIQSITGFGKFKTSSAFGTVLRAIDQDWKILIVQFLKGSETGEINIMRKYFSNNVKIMRYGANKIVLPNNIETFDKEETQRGWEEMISEIHNKKYDMLVLDEVHVALDMKLLQQYQYFDFLKNKPKELEIISTGRVTDKALMQKIELASDLHTDAICKAHYFKKKCPICKRSWEYYFEFCPNDGHQLENFTPARKGVEY